MTIRRSGRPLARCLPGGRSFSSGLRPEPDVIVSDHPALQWLFRGCRGGVPVVDLVVAGRADDQRLAPHPGHELGPLRLWPPRVGEIGEGADVVHLHLGASPAPLAPAAAEPADQLLALAAASCRGYVAVIDDR